MRNNKKNVILRLFVLIAFMLIQVVGFSISIQARIDEQQTVTMKNKKELIQENIVQNPEKQMKKIINEQFNPDRKIKKKINRSEGVGELNNNAEPEFSFVEGVGQQVDIEGWDTINLNNIGKDKYEQTTVLYPPLFDVTFNGGSGNLSRVKLYYQPDELEDNQYKFDYNSNWGYPTIDTSSDITDENEKWLGYQTSGILVKPNTEITITSLMDKQTYSNAEMHLDVSLRYFDKSGNLIDSEEVTVEEEDINRDPGFELTRTVPEDAVSLDILYNPYTDASDPYGKEGYIFGVKKASVSGVDPDNEWGGNVTISYVNEDGHEIEDSLSLDGDIGEVVSPTIYDIDGYNYVGIDGVTPIRITDEEQEIKIIYREDGLLPEESLEIETSEMSVPLGTEIDTDQVEKHITSVELLENGKPTELDDYSIDDIVTSDSVPTNVVGSGETIVNITGIKNGKEIKGVASIPTEVTWGNDIFLGGSTDPANESTLALSLINEGNNAKIVGTYGDNTKHDRPIHSSYLEKDYYQIDYFPRGTSSTLNLTNDLTEKGTKSLTLKGKQTPADAVEGWGTQVAKEGDIIRVWMEEETKLNWYQNGERQNQLSKFPNRNLIYFEVTKNGFKPLYNNQVKGKTNIPINQGTSEGTLNGRYRDNPKELLDIPNQTDYKSIQYSMNKFEQYPDTKTVGKNKTSKVSMTGQTKNSFGELNITFDVNPTFDVVEQQEYEGIIKNPEFKKEVNSSGLVTSVPHWKFSATGYNLKGGTDDLKFTDTLKDNNYTMMTRSNGEKLDGLGEIGIANRDDGTLNASVKGNANQLGGILLFVYQTIDTTPGQSYEFSVDLSSSGTDKRGFSIYNGDGVISGDKGPLGNVYKTPEVSGSETLKKIFTATSPKTTISFRFYAKSGTEHIDSIKNPTIQEISWLPSYKEKWLDATTNIIPKTNTFMMMKTQETYVSDVVGLTHANGHYQFSSGEADTPRSLIYHNVGYSDGSPVSVKVTLSPNAAVTDLSNNFIGFENDFMTIGVKSKSGVPVEMSVKYEFLDDNNQPINLSGYWTVSGLNQFKRVTLPNKQITNIYSYDRGTSPQTTIRYEEDDQNITLIGTSEVKGNAGEGVEATITYNNLDTFDFVVIPSEENDSIRLNYNQSSIPKVGIPDPQPVNQTVEKITEDNRDKLTNEFVQYIPFESPGNRDQDMTWTLLEQNNNNVFKPGSWKVYDETGKEQTDLFKFDKDAEGNKTIKPKDLSNEDLSNENLYNHYYRFVYSLPFDDKAVVNEDKLITKDGGRYLPYSQKISLEVDKLSPVVATPTTDINFMATINYIYKDKKDNPITMDGLAKTGTSLITKPYPVTEAPEIKGYTFSKSEPSDLTNKKILYTDNTVTFIYDKINKVWMTVNYFRLDAEGKETKTPVLENLKEGTEAKSLRKEIEVGHKISQEVTEKEFDSYQFETDKTTILNDVTGAKITDDIAPADNFSVNYYYKPSEALVTPTFISFGENNQQHLKEEYPVTNDAEPIVLTSGFESVNWSLQASSDGLFSDPEDPSTRLLSDMYFRIGNENKMIDKEGSMLLNHIDKNYYELPLVTKENEEGLFLKIDKHKVKESSYEGKIKFSMVTGP